MCVGSFRPFRLLIFCPFCLISDENNCFLSRRYNIMMDSFLFETIRQGVIFRVAKKRETTHRNEEIITLATLDFDKTSLYRWRCRRRRRTRRVRQRCWSTVARRFRRCHSDVKQPQWKSRSSQREKETSSDLCCFPCHRSEVGILDRRRANPDVSLDLCPLMLSFR